ncbi:MAG TPA: hypothetical protein DDY68_05575 [Porphyromonadaceae bacterium]|nr:hypothetical protein [Porphyromonadaceae bacterium]
MQVGLLGLGLLAGVFSGLFGIGGGIVMVPLLIFIFQFDILTANATSMGAMLLPVGIMGCILYYRAGLIKVSESLWISLGLFIGSFLGAEIAIGINTQMLTILYSLVLIAIALSYFTKKKSTLQEENTEEALSPSAPIWKCLITGLLAGIFAAMFGKGGGIVIVPMLVKWFKYSQKSAVATSLAALQLPVGLPGVVIYAMNGHLNLWYVSLVAIGIVIGTFLGTKVALKISGNGFKITYGIFLIFVALYMLLN